MKDQEAGGGFVWAVKNRTPCKSNSSSQKLALIILNFSGGTFPGCCWRLCCPETVSSYFSVWTKTTFGSCCSHPAKNKVLTRVGSACKYTRNCSSKLMSSLVLNSALHSACRRPQANFFQEGEECLGAACKTSRWESFKANLTQRQKKKTRQCFSLKENPYLEHKQSEKVRKSTHTPWHILYLMVPWCQTVGRFPKSTKFVLIHRGWTPARH